MQQGKLNEMEYSILLVDDDMEFLDGARRALLANGVSNVTTLNGGSNVLKALETGAHTVLLLDWVMPGLSGADLLPEVVSQFPNIPVIIITGVSDIENVVSCMRQGAYDYITKPLDTTRLVSIVQNAVKNSELVVRNRKLTEYLLGEALLEPDNFSDIITCSNNMMSIFKVIESLAGSRHPILITGESGVGKELIAEAIHRTSGLKGKMVSVNVAGVDETMFDDTLFGHKKGAFTGATESRNGLIEEAKGGTLFLDEIGDLRSSSQAKLLRLLQNHEYYRLGSDFLHKSDARIITASNRSFPALLASGAFRTDLYHRISVHVLHIPPLRERPEDIIPLVEHHIDIFAKSSKRPSPKLSKQLCRALTSYDFPGNVREMINMIINVLANNNSEMLDVHDFPKIVSSIATRGDKVRKVLNGLLKKHGSFSDYPTIDEVVALFVEDTLVLSHGNRSIAAKMLGISRPTLQKKLEQAADKRSGKTSISS